MKIRNGFVSNSSSSSFVVLLPEDFDIEEYVKNNIGKMSSYFIGDIIEYFENEFEDDMDEDNFAINKTIELVKLFKTKKNLYSYDDHMEINFISQILNEYIIASFDTSSDDGFCQLMEKSDIDKIKSILKIK